jgi:hypothetical protein
MNIDKPDLNRHASRRLTVGVASTPLTVRPEGVT